MSQPEKPQFNPQSKTGAAKPALRAGVAKPQKVGSYGRSKVNLFLKQDLDEYARANPGPGLLDKITDGIKGLLTKLTKAP